MPSLGSHLRYEKLCASFGTSANSFHSPFYSTKSTVPEVSPPHGPICSNSANKQKLTRRLVLCTVVHGRESIFMHQQDSKVVIYCSLLCTEPTVEDLFSSTIKKAKYSSSLQCRAHDKESNVIYQQDSKVVIYSGLLCTVAHGRESIFIYNRDNKVVYISKCQRPKSGKYGDRLPN